MPSVPEPESGSDRRATPPPLDLPAGVPAYMWFDGILEGPRGSDEELHDVVRRMNALGLAHADLEVDGGRFSILMSDRTLADGVQDLTRRSDLVPLLEELVGMTGRVGRGPLESTLRATEVHREVTVETMFAVQDGELRCMSRPRAVSPGDRGRAPGASVERGPGERSKRQWWLVGGLTVLAGLLVLWRMGVFAAVFGPAASDLVVEDGPFGDMLAVEVEDGILGLEVVIRRGDGYPIKFADIRERLENAATPAERAAVGRVTEGHGVTLTLEDGGGERLVEARVSLQTLLDNVERRELRLRIPSAFGAKVLALRLASSDSR